MESTSTLRDCAGHGGEISHEPHFELTMRREGNAVPMNKIVILLPAVPTLLACAPTGTALFKPTLTFGARTFRMTKDFDWAASTCARLIGDLALAAGRGSAAASAAIAGRFQNGDVALAMGNVHLEGANGDRVGSTRKFGYLRGTHGGLKIVLHHSSLNYAPAK